MKVIVAARFENEVSDVIEIPSNVNDLSKPNVIDGLTKLGYMIDRYKSSGVVVLPALPEIDEEALAKVQGVRKRGPLLASAIDEFLYPDEVSAARALIIEVCQRYKDNLTETNVSNTILERVLNAHLNRLLSR